MITDYRTLFIPQLGFIKGVFNPEIVHRVCLTNFNNHIIHEAYVPNIDVVAILKKPGMFSKSKGEKIIITRRKGHVYQSRFIWTLKDMDPGTFSKINRALLQSNKIPENIYRESYNRSETKFVSCGEMNKGRLL